MCVCVIIAEVDIHSARSKACFAILSFSRIRGYSMPEHRGSSKLSRLLTQPMNVLSCHLKAVGGDVRAAFLEQHDRLI